MTKERGIAWLAGRDRSPKPAGYHILSIRERTSASDSQIGVIDNSETFICKTLRGYFLGDLIGIL
jgi:hypothetical protein